MTLDLLASYVALATFAAVMVHSAVSDIVTMTISDRLLLLLLLTFPILAPVAGWPTERMIYALAAALVAFFICVAMFSLNWIGGGDGKMLTVSILWIGAESCLQYLAVAAIIGGLFTFALVLFRRWDLPISLSPVDWLHRLHRPGTGVPYGVALGAAGLVMLPETAWVGSFS